MSDFPSFEPLSLPLKYIQPYSKINFGFVLAGNTLKQRSRLTHILKSANILIRPGVIKIVNLFDNEFYSFC